MQPPTGRIGSGYGVSRRVNYATSVAHGLQLAVDLKVLAKPTKVRLPFEHLNGSGLACNTLLVEPPILLGRLRRDLRAEGVQFVSGRSPRSPTWRSSSSA